MNYKRKLLVLSATVGLGLSMLATQSSAITYHYNHITSQKTVFAMTTGESAVVLTANTRPASDGCGARLRVKNSSGTTIASKIFPKQLDVPSLVNTMPSYSYRKLTVEPQNSGEWITGTVYYTLT